ncbi:unnamed protein product [Chondrus crispus]|uniref:Uncharacterized protein n=1 Tax=Chondrus crispus TaxID=2769 RepID=R7QQD1_CHOCR|nr:unnamed protein product [Chondrus crispus]CDF40329.1 unnamed protein product [Chondrus crispus]|eukprot:XP_005710623.1 unnamed protein product [Chondrus crispus]
MFCDEFVLPFCKTTPTTGRLHLCCTTVMPPEHPCFSGIKIKGFIMHVTKSG